MGRFGNLSAFPGGGHISFDYAPSGDGISSSGLGFTWRFGEWNLRKAGLGGS